MPKVYATKVDRLKARMAAYVFSELKVRGIKQQELAKYMGITQQALSQKIAKQHFKFEDYVQIVNFFDADDHELRRLAGIGE